VTPALKRFSFPPLPEQDAPVREAADLVREHPRAGADAASFAPYLPASANGLPSLMLEDFSDVPFLRGVEGIEWYQLRSRTRAGEGDWFVSTQDPVPGYEEYNRERLGLGATEFLRTAVDGADPLCVADTCRKDPEAFESLVRLANSRGGLRLHPYMGSRSVWRLARALDERAEGRIEVLAPPPPATAAANHKGLLDRVVRRVIGNHAVCDAVYSKDLAELARLAKRFADYPKVALKMADYASAMGNKVYSGAELCAGTDADVEARIRAFAAEHQWSGEEEILLVEWRADSRQSPSTQLWVPPLGAGEPRVDGVFEQLLEGERCVFQGSLPSTLPEPIQERMARWSALVCRVYQRLGYVGRCSFDFVLCGDEPKFVECNGRWGGTSIPMSLLERILGRDRVPFYRARDYMDSKLEGLPFEELARRIGDALYDARTGKGHYILYNVGCLGAFGKFDVIALGENREEADRRLEEELPALL
jgi:hypothetical protein